MPVKRIEKDGSSDKTKYKCSICGYSAASKAAVTRHKNRDHKPERDTKTGRITKGVAQDTNKNGTAGAPTKYNEDICEKMIKFFSIEKKRREVVMEKTTPSKWGEAHEQKFQYFANELPTFEKFARSIGVRYSTLRSWAVVTKSDSPDSEPILEHPEFSETYNICKDLQREFLIDNGLMGLYPPASFIFVAKNITDMKDEQGLKLKKEKDADEVDDDELKAAIFE